MSSEKVMISPELSEIVRECSGEPNRMCLEENLRVGTWIFLVVLVPSIETLPGSRSSRRGAPRRWSAF